MKSVAIRLLWFAFGVSIGVLAIQYSHLFFFPETPVSAERDPLENNIIGLIHIQNEHEATSIREELIGFIWGRQGLPANLPDRIDTDVADERYSSLRNLSQIDKLTILMEWGLTSTAYHFTPTNGNNKLLIYQQGHDGDFIRGIDTISFFLEHGFSVIALSMPLESPNNQPTINLKRIGRIELRFHEQLKLLEMKSGHPVQLFLTPISISLNYAQKFGYESVYMTGVSGGGWTTTVYAAIDPRITRSYPVAGSLPTHLRSGLQIRNTAQRPADWGDYEQTIPELYNIANYLDLYILGSHGHHRKQLQVLNKYDPCCFRGEAFRTYEQVLQERVESLGSGEFVVYLDTSHKTHKISEQALTLMMNDINTVKLGPQD